MEGLEKLLNHTGSTVTDVELQRLFQETDYLRLQGEVEGLVRAGFLAPVKASKKNGRMPPLYNKYRIIKPKEDHRASMDEIRRLHPDLSVAAYLQRPEIYQKHGEILHGLSRVLWYEREALGTPMSRKERAFFIWGREKLLDEKMTLVREVLKYNGLGEDFLNYYDTPEPFFEYVFPGTVGEPVTVLVVENKDTWFTFRKLLQETGKNTLAGSPVHILLYGEGNKITKGEALMEYRHAMLGDLGQAARFFYFGDLDWEGIRLFFRTREANPSLEVRPFAPLYQLMLELAEELEMRAGCELPKSPDRRGLGGPLPEFLALLGLNSVEEVAGEGPKGRMAAFLRGVLEEGRYIPQEIINYQVAGKLLG